MILATMIDSREPATVQGLRFGGVPTVVTALDAGDLWATTDEGALLVIERKTPADLLASIKDNRLFAQINLMRERSKWVYLVITGVLDCTLDGHVIADARTTGWRWSDVQGALLTVQELGGSVVSCQSDAHYEDTVLRLAKRERAEKVIEPRIATRVLTQQEQVLTSLPGIGLERAQLLLHEFQGQVGMAIAWLTWLDTIHEIAGIGNGTKNNVRRALNLQPEEWLTVFNPAAMRHTVDHMAADNGQPQNLEVVGVRA